MACAARRAAQRAFVKDARSSSLSSSSEPFSSRMAAHRFSSSLNFLTRLSAASRSLFVGSSRSLLLLRRQFLVGRTDQVGIIGARDLGQAPVRLRVAVELVVFICCSRRSFGGILPEPFRSSPSRRCAFLPRPSRGRTWRGSRAELLGLAPRRAAPRSWSASSAIASMRARQSARARPALRFAAALLGARAAFVHGSSHTIFDSERGWCSKAVITRRAEM